MASNFRNSKRKMTKVKEQKNLNMPLKISVDAIKIIPCDNPFAISCYKDTCMRYTCKYSNR